MTQEKVNPAPIAPSQVEAPRELRLPQRDGASQANRELAALKPDYVAVDERSLKDLLAFARNYAPLLRYFGVKNGAAEATGDWSGFLSADTNLDEILAFLTDPTKVPLEQARRYGRPHFTLFLAFLQLTQHIKAQMNTLTGRHLDFYYRQFLGMTKQPATPDRVNVLVDLAPTAGEYLLPAGTLLDAGPDSLGQTMLYRTDQDIVVNPAQISRLSSVFLDKRITGLKEVRGEFSTLTYEALLNMMRIALGDPNPGDNLPKFPHQNIANIFTQGQFPLPADSLGFTVDDALLKDLSTLVNFVLNGLFLDFDDFRQLMRLKIQRDNSDQEWNQINNILEKAGKTRTGDPNYRLNPAEPRNFIANLQNVIGNPPDFDKLFDGIPQVKNVYNAYDQRTRQEVQAVIKNRLFLDMPDFNAMMQIKVRIDNEWAEINRLLAKAGQKKGNLTSASNFPAGEATNFDKNFNDAVGPVNFPQKPEAINDLASFYAAFQRVEAFFFMPAENFTYLISVLRDTGTPATPQEWDRVTALLEEAFQEKVYESRRAELNAILQGKRSTAAQAYAAMIGFALGEAAPDKVNDDLLDRLKPHIPNPDDITFLATIRDQVNSGAVVPETDWRRVIRLLEGVERNRLAVPLAQKVELLNLYATEDATSVKIEQVLGGDKGQPRWKTFGQGQLSVPSTSSPPPEFGWAISSPLLSLNQGKRTVTLILGFKADQFNAKLLRAAFTDAPNKLAENAGPITLSNDTGPFRIEISKAKDWQKPDSLTLDTVAYQPGTGQTNSDTENLKALKFELVFSENLDPLAAPGIAESIFNSPWPVLRLLLRQIWQPDTPGANTGRYIIAYQLFKDLQLIALQLKVVVTNLTPLQIQNDETSLDPSRPFEPFGSRPAAGSRLFLGHPELVYKKLDSLAFNFEWLGVPENLANYYKNYPAIKAASDFTVGVSLIDNRLEIPLTTATPVTLFLGTGVNTANFARVPDVIAKTRPGYIYDRITQPVLGENLLDWSRYLQWELNAPDFQHEAYPTLASQKTIQLAMDLAVGKPAAPDNYQVNPPYTPRIKRLSLDYTASLEILMANYSQDSRSDKIYYIHPFGFNEVFLEPENLYYYFLPQFNNKGELYIGIGNLNSPQNLTLLFQMAEGSANPDLAPEPVEWSYLDNNRWISLEQGQLLQDTTRNLINSGIIEFSLPPVQPSTTLPASLYWVRATIPQNADSVGDTIAIHTQAVSATFANQNNASDHLSQPLPAGSIKSLTEPVPEVAGIRQPYTSFGGKMIEQDYNFYTRISERLRHKQRALTLWDYERLVLAQFPQIYKVKCLPAGADMPGQVDLVVIPDIKNKLPFNPFEPKAPADLIADIETYLKQYISPFTTVTVKNAYYVPVKVRFDVRFYPGHNEGYYKKLLNDELNRFLSPWAYVESADIVIGGRIYANAIINFIEKRPYVDFIANVKLFSSEDGLNFRASNPPTDEGYWVETPRPDGVLVAAPQHEIGIIPETGFEEKLFTGINYMKIELDFIVG